MTLPTYPNEWNTEIQFEDLSQEYPAFSSVLLASLPSSLYEASKQQSPRVHRFELPFLAGNAIYRFTWSEIAGNANKTVGFAVFGSLGVRYVDFQDYTIYRLINDGEASGDVSEYIRFYFSYGSRNYRNDILVGRSEQLELKDEQASRIQSSIAKWINDVEEQFGKVRFKHLLAEGNYGPFALENSARLLGLTIYKGAIYGSLFSLDGEFRVHESTRKLESGIGIRRINDEPQILGRELQWANGSGMRLRSSVAFYDEQYASGERKRLEGAAQFVPKSQNMADLVAVTKEAKELYTKRLRDYSWTPIYPRKDAHELMEEAHAFMKDLAAHCYGFEAPRKIADGEALGPVPFAAPHEPFPALRVNRKRLPFYAHFDLYEIIDARGGPPRRTRVLYACDESATGSPRIQPLNWTSNPIHRFNKLVGLKLAKEIEIVEYLDFFCDSVSGQAGYFHIVESGDDVRWTGAERGQRDFIAGHLFPIRLWPQKPLPDGSTLTALVVYAKRLFMAEFIVKGDGRVDMGWDRELVERLRIIPEEIGPRTHFTLMLDSPNGVKTVGTPS